MRYADAYNSWLSVWTCAQTLRRNGEMECLVRALEKLEQTMHDRLALIEKEENHDTLHIHE